MIAVSEPLPDDIEALKALVLSARTELELRIGTATVKNHVHSILDKVHVRRRGEAAVRQRDRPG